MGNIKENLAINITLSAGILEIFYKIDSADEVVAAILENANDAMPLDSLEDRIGKEIGDSIGELTRLGLLVQTTQGYIIPSYLYEFFECVENYQNN